MIVRHTGCMKTQQSRQGAKAQYRHHSTYGLTRHALRSFERHLPKIGEPLDVQGAFVKMKHGAWYSVIIHGTDGSLVLRGCSWGYSGEGPRGTEQVLKALGVHPFDVHACAFEAPDAPMDINQQKEQVKVVWKLTLPASLPQLHCENGKPNFISTTTREQALRELALFEKVKDSPAAEYVNSIATLSSTR